MNVAIIQARMGSTRLPGKILMEVDGKPLLAHQLERVVKASTVDRVIVATTKTREDDAVEHFCRAFGVDFFRGSANDLLERYYLCATEANAATIVRLTADCPLSDPEIIDATVRLFRKSGAEYTSNTTPPETSRFPDGSDVEVFTMTALERAYREATDAKDREHVTFYFWKYDNGFKTCQLTQVDDWSGYRFTVDYEEDLEVVRFLITRLREENLFGSLSDIVRLLSSAPEIQLRNSRYHFGIGWG